MRSAWNSPREIRWQHDNAVRTQASRAQDPDEERAERDGKNARPVLVVVIACYDLLVVRFGFCRNFALEGDFAMFLH